MISLIWVVVALVLVGSVLAMAESSLSRMTKVRALALESEGRRNAALLVKLESDPPRYLNAVYLAVMFAQNGSAILVAILTEEYFGRLGITLASVGFTVAYFVVVEAMAKTFGILHSDRAALALAPVVYFLGRALQSAHPRAHRAGERPAARARDSSKGPFVSEEDIRTMAEVGHEEGQHRAARARADPLHLHLRRHRGARGDGAAAGHRRGRDRPAAARGRRTSMLERGFSRIPVYRDDLDHCEGFVYAKDVLRVHAPGRARPADRRR